jgi:DNA ligase (NAD+)
VASEATTDEGIAVESPPLSRPAAAGKVFVFTGTLPNLTRTAAIARLEASGGKVANSVTRATQYVVAGSDPGAKLAHAQTLGLTVIDEAEFVRLLEEP